MQTSELSSSYLQSHNAIGAGQKRLFPSVYRAKTEHPCEAY